MPPELVFISLEPWSDLWRRNQFVVESLVRRNPGLRVLFVVPPSNLGRRGTRFGDSAGPLQGPRRLEGYDRIWLAQPARLPLETVPAIREVNNRLYEKTLDRWCRRLGFRRPALWINDHHRVHLARRVGVFGPVVYDITDDWTAMTTDDRHRALMVDHDAELCRRADAVIVCSQRLYEIKRPLVRDSDRLHLIPNGVHVEHYATVTNRSLPIPEAARAWALGPDARNAVRIAATRGRADLVVRLR